MESKTTIVDLTNDALFSLAIQLELPDLLKLCSSSKKINDYICRNDNIWLYKLNKEFPNWQELRNDKNIKDPITSKRIIEAKIMKDIYKILYTWNRVEKFKKEYLDTLPVHLREFSFHYKPRQPRERRLRHPKK